MSQSLAHLVVHLVFSFAFAADGDDLAGDGNVEILSGIKEGDKVVTVVK